MSYGRIDLAAYERLTGRERRMPVKWLLGIVPLLLAAGWLLPGPLKNTGEWRLETAIGQSWSPDENTRQLAAGAVQRNIELAIQTLARLSKDDASCGVDATNFLSETSQTSLRQLLRIKQGNGKHSRSAASAIEEIRRLVNM